MDKLYINNNLENNCSKGLMSMASRLCKNFFYHGNTQKFTEKNL